MRLIDADALWRNAPNAYADCFEDCDRCTKLDNGDLYELIEKQPTVDAVEVVRCKECKHFQPFVGERKKIKAPHKDGRCWNGDCVKLDDFCSEGERRENGHD